jgi:hypothetical protein
MMSLGSSCAATLGLAVLVVIALFSLPSAAHHRKP